MLATSPKKTNRLNGVQVVALWASIEPLLTDQGWKQDALPDFEGLVTGATLGPYLTKRLGFVVNDNHIRNQRHMHGFKFRDKPFFAEPRVGKPRGPYKTKNNLLLRFNQMVDKYNAHLEDYDLFVSRFVKVERDNQDMLAYLTRTDPDWKKKL